eukprot:scaffold8248_cov258-Pinguiococcus_pyrenoidosus.AAC.4
MSALDRARGGERPARAALPLVLHRRHSPFGRPVDRLRHVGLARRKHLVDPVAQLGHLQAEVVATEVLQTEVGEPVVAHGEPLSFGVVRFDELVVVDELVQRVHVLRTTAEVDSVLKTPVFEQNFVFLQEKWQKRVGRYHQNSALFIARSLPFSTTPLLSFPYALL